MQKFSAYSFANMSTENAATSVRGGFGMRMPGMGMRDLRGADTAGL